MVDLSHEIVSGEPGADTDATRLDAPYLVYADRADLARVPLERLVNVSIIIVRAYAEREITDEQLGDPGELWGKAVLIYTGRARRWGTTAYREDSPLLTAAAVQVLVGANVALIGIDAGLNDPDGAAREALLGEDIPIVEHMTNLDLLPDIGARLTVLPPPVRGMASSAVRAVAVVPT
jgi:arylformamidase